MMNNTLHSTLAALSLGLALTTPALAQNHSAHAGHGAAPAATATASAEAVMTAGEITRVDARTGKFTIRHEEIKNLKMPPMTMVFHLQNPQWATQFKPGDKVLFNAKEEQGKLVIVQLQAAS
jgi:Cu/Ag efflux protein CusF